MKRTLSLLLSLMILLAAGSALAVNQVASEFHDGLAWFRSGDLYGFINTRGEVVIEPAYHQAVNFSDGYASVNVGTVRNVTTYYWIDTTGRVVAKPAAPSGSNYYEIAAWKDGIGICQKWTTKPDKYRNSMLGYQYINENGKPVVSMLFLSASDFDEEGYAVVGTGKLKAKAARIVTGNTHLLGYLSGNSFTPCADTYYYINKKGKQLGKATYSSQPHPFSEGLAAVPGKANAKGLSTWGYIDPGGKTVIEPQFTTAGDFRNGLALVSVGTKYGYIDQQGSFVIEAKWDSLGSFSEEGLAAVRLNDLCGFIDREGNLVGELKWASAGQYSCGLAAVKETGENGKYGYINTAGAFVIDPVYDAAYTFEDGYARVKNGIAWGAVRTDGSAAVPMAYENVIYCGNGVFQAKEYEAAMICDENQNMVTVALVNGSLPEKPPEEGREVQLIRVPEPSDGLSYSFFTDRETNEILSMNLFGEIRGESFRIRNGSGKTVIVIDGKGQIGGAWDAVTRSETDGRVILRVQQGDLYGYIGEDGTALTQVEFTQAGNYSDGAAIVWKNDQWYILDVNGNIVF